MRPLGRPYAKADILSRLLSAEQHARVVADNFLVRRLATDVALLTYRSAHVVSGRPASRKAECRRPDVLPTRTLAFDIRLANKVAPRCVDAQRHIFHGAVGFEEQFYVVAQIAALRNIHRAAQQWDEKLAVKNTLVIHLVGKSVHRG